MQRNTSSRVIVSFTGRLALRDKANAKGSAHKMGFAAKATTDFGSGDSQLVGVKAQQCGALIAVDEWTLGADPKFRCTVWSHVGQAGMWFNIALVGLLGLVRAGNHNIWLLSNLLRYRRGHILRV